MKKKKVNHKSKPIKPSIIKITTQELSKKLKEYFFYIQCPKCGGFIGKSLLKKFNKQGDVYKCTVCSSEMVIA